MGLTFDTGALVGLERRHHRIRRVFAVAVQDEVRITIPNVVLTEWWRGRSDMREQILLAIDVEPLTTSIAKVAGEAIAMIRGATAIDAIVMASAASRGDTVYTSDFEDLERLQRFFPSVRLASA